MVDSRDGILESVFGPETDTTLNLRRIKENKVKLIESLVNFRRGSGLTVGDIANSTGWRESIVERFENFEYDGETMERGLTDYALALGVTLEYSFKPFVK